MPSHRRRHYDNAKTQFSGAAGQPAPAAAAGCVPGGQPPHVSRAPVLANKVVASSRDTDQTGFVERHLSSCLADGQVRTAFLLELAQAFETLGLDLGDAVALANRMLMTLALKLPLQEIEHRLRLTFAHIMVERLTDTCLDDVVELAMHARAQRLFGALQAMLQPQRGKAVLDLSVGDGSLAGLISARITPQLHRAVAGPFHMPPDIKIGGPVEDIRLPFDDGSHEAVLMVDGLRHVGYRRQCLREIARILPAGGRLLVLEKTVSPGDVFERNRMRRLIFLTDLFMRNLLHTRASIALPDSAETQAGWLQEFRCSRFLVDDVLQVGADLPLSQAAHTLFVLRKPAP